MNTPESIPKDVLKWCEMEENIFNVSNNIDFNQQFFEENLKKYLNKAEKNTIYQVIMKAATLNQRNWRNLAELWYLNNNEKPTAFNIFSQSISSKNEILPIFIDYLIKMNYSKAPKDYAFKDKKTTEEIENIYQKNTIEYYILEDNTQELIKEIEKLHEIPSAYLEIACKFNSTKSFSFLFNKMKESQYNIENIAKDAVIGNSKTILESISEKYGEEILDNCLETCLIYHKNDLAVWLLEKRENLKQNKYNPQIFFENYNIKAYYYLKELNMIDQIDSKNEIYFPFYMSYQAENYALMRHFLKVDKRQPHEFNCFSDACKRGNVVMMQFLTDHGAKIYNNVKEPPLVKTVTNNRIEATKWLLDNGSDILWQDEKGRTLLFYSVRFHSVKVCKLLIKKGVDVNKAANDGTTPLMEAASFGNGQIIKLLLQHDANPQLTNKYGETAQQIAYEEGRPDIANIINKFNQMQDTQHKKYHHEEKRTHKRRQKQRIIQEEEDYEYEEYYSDEEDDKFDDREVEFEETPMKEKEMSIEEEKIQFQKDKKKMSTCCRI